MVNTVLLSGVIDLVANNLGSEAYNLRRVNKDFKKAIDTSKWHENNQCKITKIKELIQSLGNIEAEISKNATEIMQLSTKKTECRAKFKVKPNSKRFLKIVLEVFLPVPNSWIGRKKDEEKISNELKKLSLNEENLTKCKYSLIREYETAKKEYLKIRATL